MASLEELLGFVLDGAPDDIRLSAAVRREHFNVTGRMHGVLPTALADTAMGGLLMSRIAAQGRYCVTVEMSSRFVRSAQVGQTLTAWPRIRHLGERTAVTEADVRDSDGRLMLIATATYAIRAKAEQAEGD